MAPPSSSSNNKHRKRLIINSGSSRKRPTPLGVLEFTSALNGDDPILILQKLHHFVRVVGYERRLVTAAEAAGSVCVDKPSDAAVNGDEESDKDDASYISFDDDSEEDDTSPASKRQKLLQLTTSSSSKRLKHSWKLDKSNYNVPFVGTSVTKGETGTITLNNDNTYTWPTGFMEVYRRCSPLGVELNRNEYISAVPPGGIHKSFCKEGGNDDFLKDDGSSNNDARGQQSKKKKRVVSGIVNGRQSRGYIMSITLQTKYWMAVNEWILSFVPIEKLRQELHWDGIIDDDCHSTNYYSKSSDIKCTLPPQIMTVLMKERLPEWIDAIYNNAARQKYYSQLLQKERKEQRQKQKKMQLHQNQQHQHQKFSKEDKAMEQKRQQEIQLKKFRAQRRLIKQRSREEALLLSALYCLTSLCHLSIGTAREVLRRLASGVKSSAKDHVPAVHGGGKFVGKVSSGGSANGGTDWMVQLFCQGNNSWSPSNKPQIECLRLICTLLETQDYIVLSRLTEVASPGWAVKRGGGKKDVGNFGVDTALRYGIQLLLDIVKQQHKNERDRNDKGSADDDMYAECIARLLRRVYGIILPSSSEKNQNGSKKGSFVIGMNATAELLSGDVLSNLSVLSSLAPPFAPTLVSIQDIINGEDVYDDLDSTKTAAVEARRLLFSLLADTRRSPFLRHGSGSIAEKEDQFNAYLPQLSKSLHSLLVGQGHSVSLKMFLELCLRKTPEITPHFFRSFQLSDPKPNYRSLAALTFVEGMVREIPCPRVRALRDGKMPASEQVVSEIIPYCVTKSLLSKVLQSSCALLTSSGLKLIITLLRRTRGVSIDESMNGEDNSAALKKFRCSLHGEVMSHMPELPILLSIPSRFDPFVSHKRNGLAHSNTIVMLQLCEAFHCYAHLDSSCVVNAKYDWVKFLPLDEPSERSFFNADPLLQYRILRTLRLVSKLEMMSFSSKILLNALTIMSSALTTIPEVYEEARELALSLLEKELFPQSDNNVEAVSRRKYESSLWVDAISENTIDDLKTMIEETRQQSVQHKMTILQALSKANIGFDSASRVSSLLSLSISYLTLKISDSVPFSGEFGLCLVQISTNMLLFQANYSKHLAAVILHADMESFSGDNHAAGLYKVAKALVEDGYNANVHLHALASKIFHKECPVNCILRISIGKAEDVTKYNFTPETMRQCLSLLKCSTGDCRDELMKLLRQMVVHICIFEGPGVVTEIETMLFESSLNVKDLEGIVLVLFSFLRSTGFQSIDSDLESSLLEYSDDVMESATVKVVSSLLRHNVAPANRRCGATEDIWRECYIAVVSKDAKKLRLKKFFLTVVVRIFPDTNASIISPPLATIMFDLWIVLVDDLDDPLSVEVCFKIADCLAEIFISQELGHLAWTVYQNLCKLGIDSFIRSSMRTLVKQEELGRQSRYCFLASVMSYDSSNFACFATVLIEYKKYERIWLSGLLDMVASTFVMKVFTQTNLETDGAKIAKVIYNRREIAERIGNRFMTLLREMDYNKEPVVSVETIVGVLVRLCSEGFIRSETVQFLVEIFDSLDKGTFVLLAKHEVVVVRLVICIASKQGNEMSTSIMITKSFLRCCKLIPTILKKLLGAKVEEEELTTSLENLIGFTAKLWECAKNFRVDILSSSSSTIDSLVVSCLKYGMADASESTSRSVLGGCLKIIRLILSRTSKGELSVVKTIVPGQVHAMAISHSAFELVIKKKGEAPMDRSVNGFHLCQGLSQQRELIRLLLCCISLDADHVKIDTDTWACILSAYDASTSVTDRLLRRLLFLYDKNNCCKDEILLCDYQWGRLCKKHILRMSTEGTSPIDEQQSWDWFVDSINFDRLRSTLSQFPFADTLEPLAESDVESRSMTADNLDDQIDVGTDDESEGSCPCNIDDSQDFRSSTVAKSDESKKISFSSNIDSVIDCWRGTGEDPRYSPGFILPLVLGALEANLQNDIETRKESQSVKEKEVYNENDDDESKDDVARHHAFGIMARRLCDRGCISLALASLSSRCPSVRKVAVAICGLFLKALQMQESHGMKSWRERPQQEMIMASLQRGLAIRRAMQMKKLEEANEGIALGDTIASNQRYNVPMLPAVSAVFLAKALLVLSKPGDDMYAPMNKYFLRLNDYHGAFQDCFGLPVFLSLYCSSSDDLTRCRIERNWALLTLKDSVVDGFCYRIISQHHVPELIMSSFDSICDQPGGKSELSLTIDVIQRLIQSGGSRSATHLIKRLGILSWLHGVVSWRSISSVLPSATLKIKFLGLITTAVESYCNEYSTSNGNNEDQSVFFEYIPLTNAVIQICLDGLDTHINNDGSSDESESVLTAACEALWAIYAANKKRKDTTQRIGLTTLTHMVNLLTKCVQNDELFSKALTAMSALPCSILGEGKDERFAHLFCRLALSFILDKRVSICPGDTIISILQRVYDVMSKFPLLREDPKLITKIMQSRHIAASIEGGMRIWGIFIPFLN